MNVITMQKAVMLKAYKHLSKIKWKYKKPVSIQNSWQLV
jgi:hypothetical protein